MITIANTPAKNKDKQEEKVLISAYARFRVTAKAVFIYDSIIKIYTKDFLNLSSIL